MRMTPMVILILKRASCRARRQETRAQKMATTVVELRLIETSDITFAMSIVKAKNKSIEVRMCC